MKDIEKDIRIEIEIVLIEEDERRNLKEVIESKIIVKEIIKKRRIMIKSMVKFDMKVKKRIEEKEWKEGFRKRNWNRLSCLDVEEIILIVKKEEIFKKDKEGSVGKIKKVGKIKGIEIVGIGLGKRMLKYRKGDEIESMRKKKRGIFIVKDEEIIIYGIGIEKMRIMIKRKVLIYIIKED